MVVQDLGSRAVAVNGIHYPTTPRQSSGLAQRIKPRVDSFGACRSFSKLKMQFQVGLKILINAICSSAVDHIGLGSKGTALRRV